MDKAAGFLLHLQLHPLNQITMKGDLCTSLQPHLLLDLH